MRENIGTWKSRILLPAALALTFGSSAAWATMISFTGTGQNANNAAEAVSAQADFVTSNGLLTVTLTNLLAAADINSAGQALSDISFDLSDDVGVIGALTAAGQFGDVDGSGNVTLVAADSDTGDTTPVRWYTNGSIGGTSITLETIGGGQPSQMILPNALSFPGANASITNGQFNSFVIGSATFTLQLAGITDATTISNVIFSFGTSPDTFITGVPVPIPGIPEPSDLALIATGLVALVALRRRAR
jgi:hypothetical protein